MPYNLFARVVEQIVKTESQSAITAEMTDEEKAVARARYLKERLNGQHPQLLVIPPEEV